MVYLLGWGAIYYSLLVSAITSYRIRSFGFLTILLFAGISVFRGSTGTDTANYESMLAGFSLNTIWESVEPGFVLLGLLFKELFGSAETGVRAVSALFFILVAFYYFRADRNEAYILLAYMAPAYFYQYSMNVLRLGLASILLLIAIQALRNRHMIKSNAIMAMAVLFHYSILFSICYLVINFFKSIKLGYVFVIGVFILLVLYIFNEHILLKMSTYTDYEPPSSISGLSKVLIILLLILGVIFSRLPATIRNRVFFTTILFTGFALGVTSFSYAGLRLLDLIAFALPLVILMLHSEANHLFNWKTKLSFLLAGGGSAVAAYRGFLIEAGQGKSPFLPYELKDIFF